MINRYRPRQQIITPYSNIYEDAIYDGRYEYKLNHVIGDLTQCFIKATVVNGIDAAVSGGELGLKLIRSIKLHDQTRTIAMLNEHSMKMRLDRLNGTPLFDKIDSCVNISGLLTNETVELYIPLFFFFSDGPEYALDLKNRKQMYIEITTNKNKEAFGLDKELVSVRYDLITFHKRNEVSGSSFVPRPVKNPYSVFCEKPLLCPSGSTSARILLNCPYKAFNVNFLIRYEGFSSSIKPILTLKLETPELCLYNLPIDFNYTFYSQENTSVNASITYQFGTRHDGEHIKFTQEMSPTYATLTFDPIQVITVGKNFYLHVCYEYFTELEDVNAGGGEYILTNNVAGIF